MDSVKQARFFSTLISGRSLVMLLFGFSSGLPFAAISATLQAWLTERNVELSSIGLFGLVMLPYSLKFLWAPLMDRYVVLPLGRRRGWVLPIQIGLLCLLAGLGQSRPEVSLATLAMLAFATAFFSASQDIILDAYRRDSLPEAELGFGSAVFITGYRAGALASGPLALYLSTFLSWEQVYLCIAAWMLIGIVTTVLAPEPEGAQQRPVSLWEAVYAPLLEYFRRFNAWWILAFIVLYKVGDIMAAALQISFFLQVDYSKAEIALVAKTFGLISATLGGLIGGAMMLRISMARALWVFGILQALSTLGFALIAASSHSVPLLAAVIAFENITGGMGTAAYSGFMASLCNKRFSATQYALLSSLMGLSRSVLTSPSGFVVERMGWFWFFVLCTVAALPGLFLIPRAARD